MLKICVSFFFFFQMNCYADVDDDDDYDDGGEGTFFVKFFFFGIFRTVIMRCFSSSCFYIQLEYFIGFLVSCLINRVLRMLRRPGDMTVFHL